MDGQPLIEADFGEEEVTFSEAFRRNPRAIAEHVLWHLGLLPAGIQMGLFNCQYGAYSPDFTPPRQKQVKAAVLTLLYSTVVVAGCVSLRKRRAFRRRFFATRAGWCWLALLCTLPTCFVAIVTERPRPSYIFLLSVFLMGVCGLCLAATLRELKLWKHFRSVLPLAVLVILLTESRAKTTAQLYTGQPLLEMYGQIRPFRSYVQQNRGAFASRMFSGEIVSYLAPGKWPPSQLALGDGPATSADFSAVLERGNVGMLYLNAADLHQPAVTEWLKSDDARRWRILAQYPREPGQWMLLVHERG